MTPGRSTVTNGIRAAGLSDPFRPCDMRVAAAGKKVKEIAVRKEQRDGSGCSDFHSAVSRRGRDALHEK
jgi:hypothetical protein